jgi:hypothetical protein
MRTLLVSLLALPLLACGEDSHDEGHDDPEITMVEWTHVDPCVNGTASAVMITITAADPNTPVADLSFSASAIGCTGTVTAATGMLTCPQMAPYPGTATVSDDEGHSDTQSFTIAVCVDGSAP